MQSEEKLPEEVQEALRKGLGPFGGILPPNLALGQRPTPDDDKVSAN